MLNKYIKQFEIEEKCVFCEKIMGWDLDFAAWPKVDNVLC